MRSGLWLRIELLGLLRIELLLRVELLLRIKLLLRAELLLRQRLLRLQQLRLWRWIVRLLLPGRCLHAEG